MFQYTAYHLGISSEIELPALTSGDANGDLRIFWDSSVPVAATSEKPIVMRLSREESILSFHPVGHFRLRAGRELAVSPVFEGGLAAVRLFLTGIAMGTILYQRGLLVLHASCVNLSGKAVAFIGSVAAGKSTIAAALYSRGHAVVADDNTAVVWQNGAPGVLPGFPQLKVAPALARALGYEAAALRFLHSLESKRGLPVAAGFPSAVLPLQAIYLLSVEARPGIERVSQKDALIHLLRQSMPTRLSQPDSPEHFLACARAASEIPLFLLRRTASVAAVGDLARMLEEHASAGS